jgi:hypothetical protein
MEPHLLQRKKMPIVFLFIERYFSLQDLFSVEILLCGIHKIGVVLKKEYDAKRPLTRCFLNNTVFWNVMLREPQISLNVLCSVLQDIYIYFVTRNKIDCR